MTTSKSSNSTAGKGCATVFLSLFALFGLVFVALVGKAGFDAVRTWFWERTDCVIESSAVQEKNNETTFVVQYRYQFGGRQYTGGRVSAGIQSSMNAEKAQRLAHRYPPGTRAECFVNSRSPAECVLERGSVWSLALLPFPLIFVAIGVFGIIGVWRAKPTPTVEAASERHRPRRGGTIFVRILGLIFMCVGGGLLWVLLIQPFWKEDRASRWPQVPCEIISSRVASHDGDESTTYSVEVRYKYEFKGKNYTGTRYNFDTGSSSSRTWKQAAVAAHPRGMKTLCYVNPEDPLEAVLSIKPQSDRWFGLIPLVFFLAGLALFSKAPALGARSATASGLPTDGLPQLPRDLATGEIELKPATPRVAGCIVIFIIAAFWNGITWAIMLNLGKGEWFGRIFLSIFALIGLGLLAIGVYSFLGLFNPRPILTASSTSIPLGGTLDVRWRFLGNVRRIVKLRVCLEAREEATYRRGTTTTTDRCVFAIIELIEATDRGQIASGSAKVTIPRELIHTFTAPNNKIVWTLRLAGDVPKWPDVSAEYPITVLPRDTATLFQIEPPSE